MIKALRRKENRVSVSEIPIPEVEGEARVKVLLSGICNTDLEIAKGYAGFTGTIGHEFVGRVESAPGRNELVGKKVLGEINVGCETCDWCKTQDARHCPNRTVLGIINRDGCHAEFLTIPARNLLEIPESIPIGRAVFAEPLAAAYGILEQVDVHPETRVAVIGDGKLGILCAWSLALKSQHLFLIGKHLNKLRIGQLGNAEGVLLEDSGKMERSFDVVVEASGSQSGFEHALKMVRPRGKIVLKSTFHGKAEWEAWKVVVDEVTVVGSRCGKFEPIVGMLGDTRFPFEELISKEFPLEKGVEALEYAAQAGVMKVLLRP